VVEQADQTRLPVELVVADYCDGVLSGAIPACELVHAAVRRHQRSADGRFYFDAAAAQLVVDFCLLLRHTKGPCAGEPFLLEPWEVFIVAMLFGWKVRSTGRRRFRVAYIELPRKNGKSTLLAAIELYCFIADGESGAEVYTGATKLAQARIIWEQAVQMVKASPDLGRYVRIFRSNMSVDATGSKCEPLGRDHDTMDGLNPSMVAVDELHAHTSSGVWDVLDTATGSRAQPLKVAITTAGYDQTGICYEMHKYALRILDEAENRQTDESFFCYIATVDKADLDAWADPADPRQCWNDEQAWIRANPNWGVSVDIEGFRDMAQKAANVPSQRPAFMTKLLNVWTLSSTVWLPIEKWDACGGHDIDLSQYTGRTCWAGMDLANSRDLASFVLAFDGEDGDSLDIIAYSFMPIDMAREAANVSTGKFEQWADDPKARLILTNGSTIDYQAIIKAVVDAGQMFDLRFICSDRWGLEFLRQKLADCGAEILPFGQGFQSMGPAIEELERLIYGGMLRHDDNPLLRWAVGNVMSETSPQNKIRFNKKKSEDKIDPAVAMAMAVGGVMLGRAMAKTGTFYEDHELEMA